MVLPKRLSFASYLLFTTIILISLFWLRFPLDAAEDFLINQIESSFPRYNCTTSKVSFQLPFSLQVDSITLKERNKKSIFLELKDVIIKPKLSDPLNSFQLTATLLEGAITTDIIRKPQKRSLELTNLTLTDAALALGEQNKESSLTGRLSLTGNYRFFYIKDKAYSEFETNITIRDGLLKKKTPFLTLNSIDISLAKLSFIKKNNKLVLSEGTTKGKELHASLSGGIKPLRPAENSTLHLRGKITPQQALLAENGGARKQVSQLQKKFRQKALPFVISGKISNPVFTIKN